MISRILLVIKILAVGYAEDKSGRCDAWSIDRVSGTRLSSRLDRYQAGSSVPTCSNGTVGIAGVNRLYDIPEDEDNS